MSNSLFLWCATALSLFTLLSSCGNEQVQRLWGQQKADGGISSTGDKEQPPPSGGDTGQSYACQVGIDLTKSQFSLATTTKGTETNCLGKKVLQTPACIVSLTFLDNNQVKLNYSRNKALPLFSRNSYTQCNNRLTINFDKEQGARELHDFAIAANGQSLQHIPTGQIYVLSRRDR